jgi:hypothetical protein
MHGREDARQSWRAEKKNIVSKNLNSTLEVIDISVHLVYQQIAFVVHFYDLSVQFDTSMGSSFEVSPRFC